MNNTYTLRATWLAVSIFWLSVLSAQSVENNPRVCLTEDVHKEKMVTDPAYRKSYLSRKERAAKRLAEPSFITKSLACDAPLVVPIAVHFQNAANVDLNCLRDLAADQIRILNEDFQGKNPDLTNWTNDAAAFFPGINNGEFCLEFVLATRNHPQGFGLAAGDPAVTVNQTNGSQNLAWADYFNIYVRNLSALGTSPLGGKGDGDGVVIDNNAFGSGAGCAGFVPAAPYNFGRTLTHELGHYLDLIHIWGEGCNTDDGVADTPESEASHSGCPDISAATCGSRDLHMNYMDYTSDACMYMFTAGQASRMNAYLESNLANIVYKAQDVTGPAMARVAFMEPTLSITEGTINCGDGGRQQIPILVSLSEAPDADATVDILVAGTAEPGVDFTISPTSLNFMAGADDDQTVMLEIFGDGRIENDEEISLTLQLNANGSNTMLGSQESHIITLVNDDRVPSEIRQIPLVRQDFNEGLGDWTVVDGGSTTDSWGLSLGSGGLNGTQYVIANSDEAGNGTIMDEQLLSPVFDGKSVTNLRLDLDQFIRVYNRGGEETFDIDIWDGSDWQNVFHHEEADGSLGDYAEPDAQSFDLSAFAATNNQLRFTYRAEYDWFWILDNIVVSGMKIPDVQEQANEDAGFVELQFGPSETVYFYDQLSGNIMMSLKNLGDHDFGCTRVEVDRSADPEPGGTMSSSLAQRMLMDKSFKVTPANNEGNGTYSISLYFSREEIDDWLQSSGETIESLVMLKAPGSVGQAMELEEAAAARTTFQEDYVFTATFNSGFSGFTLGGSVLALPVEYIDFSASAREKTIMLAWETAVELNNAGFEVWRKSETASRFSQVGFVQSEGGNVESNYSFTDAEVLPGQRYFYQLQQLNFDGELSPSSIVSAKLAAEGFSFEISPNPARDFLNLTVSGSSGNGSGSSSGISGSEAGAIELLDGSGRVLRTLDLRQEDSNQQLNLQGLPAGIYFVSLVTANDRQVRRLVKR